MSRMRRFAPMSVNFARNLPLSAPRHQMKPALVPLSTSSQQAAFVAQRVLDLHEEGIALHEMAVLYRAHYHSMEVQLEFTRRGIPFVITSGLRFFEQAHIKDVCGVPEIHRQPAG